MSSTVTFVLFLAAAQGGGDNIGRESTTVDFSWTCDFSTSRLLLGGGGWGEETGGNHWATVSRLDKTSAVLECALDFSQKSTHTRSKYTVTPSVSSQKRQQKMSEELTPLRFSQFPGVPPFLNYIVGPEDCPIHPPPILRSLIKQPISVSSWPRYYVNSSWNLQINGTDCKSS